MSKKIAIILSGCGFKDGAEIHESVLTLLAVVKAGAQPIFFAPNTNQATVTNHINNDSTGEIRNVLVESSRIARGDIQDVKTLKANNVDAVIFPGGYGAALNLCNFAQKGPDCDVNSDIQKVIEEFFAAKKTMGFICIAPALAARVLGKHGISLTIGTDAGTAQAIEKMGAKHQNCAVDEICVDEKNKVVSTPAYMLAKNISEAELGISKLVKKVISLT
ncbi:MAG TPA: isoprenoid biosynthesis protein ElbB [Deltaproteobacteria bacterium]|nr:MAG: isoprenoid biosynthesis protein ElbB [Deltaproteobacteria bacterium GWA2_45_12]HBF12843.1 isoprenoid biosynthesis protein ElbB [Deltaproteobacteria bacterium]